METIDLSRFTRAHRRSFPAALEEIRSGKKRGHWMWYIFPQIQGLGHSSTAALYAIDDLEEAEAFLKDPYLGGNLIQISRALLELETDDPSEIFDDPDDLKLRSCMTLFSVLPGADAVFEDVLLKFFDGYPDEHTLRILSQL